MANKKVTDLDPITTAPISGVMHFVDTTDSTQNAAGSSFKVTKQDFLKENTAAILLNTVKVGITPSQSTAILLNTAKVGITTGQASSVTDNTEKLGLLPTTNYTIKSKGNVVNPTLIQVDLVFDLLGISFGSGNSVSVNFNINSTDSNLGTPLQCRMFQNNVPTPTDASGTQISPFSIGTYTAPSTDISFTKILTLSGFRYLHVFLEVSPIIANQLTTFAFFNPSITLSSIKRLPIRFGIFRINAGDSIVYEPLFNNYITRYLDVKSLFSSYIPVNNLTGKKLVIIGDSMIKGHTLPASDVFDSLIAVRNSMTNINYGINGIQLTNNNASGTSVLNGYSAMVNDADYVGVFAGTNDQVAGVPIGGDTDSFAAGQLTFKGALNDLCKGLITKYPAKKVFFITPYNRISFVEPYVLAILTICRLHSISVFDNFTRGGVLFSNSAQVAALTLGDAYHLNAAGMINAATKYEDFLRQL